MKSDELQRLVRWRDGLREHPIADIAYRGVVGIVGLVALVFCIVVIPIPGVFVALGILATEFGWARRLLALSRRLYDHLMAWFWGLHRSVQFLVLLLTAAVVVTALWVVGVLGWVAGVFGVEWSWLTSPLGLGE